MAKYATMITKAVILATLFTTGFGLIFMGFLDSANAFGGKCSTRSGEIDIECMQKNKKRYVFTTYARDLPNYYRRSRSGTNWENHQNREYTGNLRSKFNTYAYKSNIYAKGKPNITVRSYSAGQRVQTNTLGTSAAVYARHVRNYMRGKEHRDKFKAVTEAYAKAKND